MYDEENFDNDWTGWISIPGVVHPEVEKTIKPPPQGLSLRSAIAVVIRDDFDILDTEGVCLPDVMDDESSLCRKGKELPLPDLAALTLSAAETERLNAARLKKREEAWQESLCQLNL